MSLKDNYLRMVTHRKDRYLNTPKQNNGVDKKNRTLIEMA
jgi:hypothetical protein